LAFGLAASAALIGFAGPAQAAPPGFTARDRDDAICMVVFGSVLGAMPDGEDKEGLSSVLTYFIGKLKGRHPALAMTELLAPDYVLSLHGEIASSAKRCAEEAVAMGLDLQEAGRILVDLDKQPAPTS
jgi:hypothetical protein